MERPRPGDVSPMVHAHDEYRQTNDVSPLSPLDGSVSRATSLTIPHGRTRSLRVPPNYQPTPIRPPETSEIPRYGDNHQQRHAEPDYQSPETQTFYTPASPVHGHLEWPENFGFGRAPNLDLRHPESPRSQSPQSPRGTRHQTSIDSLQQVARTSREASRHRNYDGDPMVNSATFARVIHEFWDPPWLREWVLIGLGMAFALVAVVILVLYVVSSRATGLGSYVGPVGLLYLWKYIPTAVIVILLALWNCVDSTARLLQPWVNLRDGPSSASSTLFLDLISPNWPRALLRACKSRGYVPILTITCVVLLDIIRILSTSLLQLESISIEDENFPMVKTAAFDASSWSPRSMDNVTSMLYNRILSEDLSRPQWVLINATFEPFETSKQLDTGSKSTLIGTTRGFFPSLVCEDATPEITNNYSYTANMTFTSDSCSVELELDLVDQTQTRQRMNTWLNRNFMGHIQKIVCPDKTSRFLAAVTVVDSQVKLTGSSAIFCKPSYFIQDIPVTMALPELRPSINWTTVGTSPLQLAGLNDIDLLDNIVNFSSYANLPPVYQPSQTTINDVAFLRLAAIPLTKIKSGTAYLEPFLDPTVMAEHMGQAFSGMASLAVSNHMLSPQTESMTGTAIHQQDRVQVRLGAAAPLIALLLLCLGISIAVLFTRPQDDVVPRDPRSIGGVALLLRNSDELNQFFINEFDDLKYTLRNQRFCTQFSTRPDVRFVVERDRTNTRFPDAKDTAHEADALKWWKPITLRIWCRALVIVLPLALIGALEGVQQVSNRPNGIATVLTPESAHYGATVIPAMIMWIVVALYSSVNLNTVLISPYYALSNGGATADRSIFDHNLGRLPLVQLISSIKQRHIAVIFTTLTAIVGPVLIVVVSGLYSVTSNGGTTTVLMSRTDTFNTSWSGAPSDDGGSAQALSLIVWQNLSYPDWTYDDLAIPQVALGATESQLLTRSASLMVTLPARRAILDCETNGPDDVVIGIDESGAKIYTNIVSTCPGTSSEGIPIVISTNSSSPPKKFASQLSQLSETGYSAQVFGPSSSNTPPMNDPGCQSLIFFYGSFQSQILSVTETFNLTSSEAQVTTLACKQHIQEVDVQVSLLVPNLTIDPSQPPVADESTARYVDNGTAQEFLVMYPITAQFTPVTDDPSIAASMASLGDLDAFYKAIVLTTGIQPTDLVGTANIPRLVNATSKMYGRYMAQAMSQKMRSSVASGSAQPQTVSAVLTYSETRLIQNRAPKIALQVLLGFMALCGIAAWLSLHTSGLLPHDPCSIAGTAALLAGGELWRRAGVPGRGLVIPEGAEWLGDQELEKQGLWRGLTFGLGWWPDGRYGIDSGGPINEEGG